MFDSIEALSDERFDLNRPVVRFARNPILTSHEVNRVWRDPGLRVKTVHNAGATLHDGRFLLLFRSHLRCGLSVLGVARSDDGLGDWRVDPWPAMAPCCGEDAFADGVDRAKLIENESGGVEDARITRFHDQYYITYSAYHAQVKDRVRVSLAVTRDFQTFTRYGPVLDRDMRNVVIFPERISGRFVGLFRPNETGATGDVGGQFTQIRLGTTDSIEGCRWEVGDQPLFQTGCGPSAFADKIGPGAPPIRTRHGWINIFHGVRATMDGHPYSLGVALHEIDRPERVTVSSIPILLPSRADCVVGPADYVHVPNVVFTCGAVRLDSGVILIYYGGNDTVMNVAATHEDVLVELCRRYPLDRNTGVAAYDMRGARPSD